MDAAPSLDPAPWSFLPLPLRNAVAPGLGPSGSGSAPQARTLGFRPPEPLSAPSRRPGGEVLLQELRGHAGAIRAVAASQDHSVDAPDKAALGTVMSCSGSLCLCALDNASAVAAGSAAGGIYLLRSDAGGAGPAEGTTPQREGGGGGAVGDGEEGGGRRRRGQRRRRGRWVAAVRTVIGPLGGHGLRHGARLRRRLGLPSPRLAVSRPGRPRGAVTLPVPEEGRGAGLPSPAARHGRARPARRGAGRRQGCGRRPRRR